MQKHCTKCNENKPLENYTKDVSKRDGLRNYCRACEKQTGRLKYQTRKVEKALYRNSLVARLASYRCGAKKRGHSFDLTIDEFTSFWQKPCSYCGGSIATVGIDRVDSSVGYQINNCVPCCSRCNKMKLDTNEQEWYDHMLTILNYRGII